MILVVASGSLSWVNEEITFRIAILLFLRLLFVPKHRQPLVMSIYNGEEDDGIE